MVNTTWRWTRDLSARGIDRQDGRSAPVKVVHPPIDIAKHIADPGNCLQVCSAPRPRTLLIRSAVHRLLDHRNRSRLLRFGVDVGVDGQVPVRADVPGQEVPDPAGQ